MPLRAGFLTWEQLQAPQQNSHCTGGRGDCNFSGRGLPDQQRGWAGEAPSGPALSTRGFCFQQGARLMVASQTNSTPEQRGGNRWSVRAGEWKNSVRRPGLRGRADRQAARAVRAQRKLWRLPRPGCSWSWPLLHSELLDLTVALHTESGDGGGWRGTTQQRPGGGPRLHPRGDLTWACPTGCTPIRERLPRGGGPSERSRPFTGIPGPQHTHSLHFQSWAATGGWTNPSSASSSLHACAGSRIPGPLRKVDQLGLEAGKFHGGGFLQEAAQTVPSQGPCEPRWGRSAGDGVVSAG